MSSSDRDGFAHRVATHVRKKFPLVKVVEGEHPFVLRLNGRLEELENLFRLVSLQPEEADHQIDRWVVELIRSAEGTPDRSAAFEDIKGKVLPMLVAGENLDAYQGTVNGPLVEGLNVAYAIDQDRTINYISRERFAGWKMSVDDLHELAIENLVTRSESLPAQAAEDEDGTISLLLFQTFDGYDASRLLLPTLHERLKPILGSPFGAAVPNRDLLLCFRNDEPTKQRLRAQVAEDYRSMPHQVSDRLLLVTADGIAMME